MQRSGILPQNLSYNGKEAKFGEGMEVGWRNEDEEMKKKKKKGEKESCWREHENEGERRKNLMLMMWVVEVLASHWFAHQVAHKWANKASLCEADVRHF